MKCSEAQVGWKTVTTEPSCADDGAAEKRKAKREKGKGGEHGNLLLE